METINSSPPTPYRVEDHYTPRQIKFNYQMGVINGVLYIFGASLLDPTLVLVAFLSNFTQSSLILGMVVPILQAGWSLPQLWVSGIVQNQPKKIKLYRLATYVRIAAWTILALTMNLVREPTLLLVLFFITFTISSLASGLAGLPFMELVSKTVPARRRGEMFAWRLGLGGILGVAGGFFVRWILSPQSPFPYPNGYGILAIGNVIFASIGLLFYNQVQEVADSHVLPRQPVTAQLKDGLAIFDKNRNFRNFLLFQVLMIFSGVAVPFFAVYVQQHLGGDKSWVGIYLIITAISNLLANLLFGRISRRISNQVVLRWATLSGFMMSLWVLALLWFAGPLQISPEWASLLLAPAFIFNSFRQTGISVSGNSTLLSISPPNSRAVMVGFSQTLIGITLIITGFSGGLVDWLGLPWLVLMTAAINLPAFWLVRKIHEGNQ
jgi:MFS family permease